MVQHTTDRALVELLQRLIRNRCVNDGTPESGGEYRNADSLEEFLAGLGLEFRRHEPARGRTTLVARLRGKDREAPSLCLMGHLDVVPADEREWTRDPFGGELVDGVVWGRGAVDMLNQTAAQAVALRRLVEDGFRPSGDLVLLAPADEEAGGVHGVQSLVASDTGFTAPTWLVTEGGGFHLPWLGRNGAAARPGRRICVAVGEKGPRWMRLRAGGTAGHASIPYHSDNALQKVAAAAVALNGHSPPEVLDDRWPSFVDAFGFETGLREALLDPSRVPAALSELARDRPVEAAVLDASCHTTFSCNVMHAGSKINVIASDASATLDVRMLPGTSTTDVDAEIDRALGDLADEVSVEETSAQVATISPASGALWDGVRTATEAVLGQIELVPWTTPFATDARFLRPLGTVAYGATLHDETMDLAAWLSLFHGRDERVSTAALVNAAAFYEALARALLG